MRFGWRQKIPSFRLAMSSSSRLRVVSVTNLNLWPLIFGPHHKIRLCCSVECCLFQFFEVPSIGTKLVPYNLSTIILNTTLNSPVSHTNFRQHANQSLPARASAATKRLERYSAHQSSDVHCWDIPWLVLLCATKPGQRSRWDHYEYSSRSEGSTVESLYKRWW